MRYVHIFTLGVILPLSMACAQTSSVGLEATMQFTSEHPLEHCLDIKPSDVHDVVSGRRRLLVTFNAYEPPRSGHTGFQLSILTFGDQQSYKPIDRFAIHPPAAFSTDTGVEPHRFLISIASHVEVINIQKICFQLAFKGQYRGIGSASVSLEWSDVP